MPESFRSVADALMLRHRWTTRPSILVLAGAIGVGLAFSVWPAASDAARSCPGEGESCVYTFKRDGERVIQRRFQQRYLERDTLCVRAPRGSLDCATKRLRPRAGGGFAVTMRWPRDFRERGRGRYRITYQDGEATGLSFRAR